MKQKDHIMTPELRAQIKSFEADGQSDEEEFQKRFGFSNKPIKVEYP